MTLPVRAVAFDVFGTLVRIGAPRHPYPALVRACCGDPATRTAARRVLMTRPLDLAAAAAALGGCPAPVLARLQDALEAELASLHMFADAAAALVRLRTAGLRIALCSNLSQPYAAPVRTLLPLAADAELWSFEVGAMKPEPAMFRAVLEALGTRPEETLMVGDTLGADWHGARAAGMPALHLVRRGIGVTPDGIGSLAALPRRLGIG